MTVGAVLRDPYSPTSPEFVSEAIKSYIRDFFTCRHCANNFANETKHNELDSVSNDDPYRAVIWLWQIHNLVNVRLSGERISFLSKIGTNYLY